MAEDEQNDHQPTSSSSLTASAAPRWGPGNRPQSTVVQNFSADLDSMFGLSPELDSLSQTVTAKQQTVSSAEQELQALEARLRETEQRLAKVSRQSSPSRPPPPAPPSKQAVDGAQATSPLGQRPPTFPADRPPTATAQQQQQFPPRQQSRAHQEQYAGAAGANGEYVMVDRNGQ